MKTLAQIFLAFILFFVSENSALFGQNIELDSFLIKKQNEQKEKIYLGLDRVDTNLRKHLCVKNYDWTSDSLFIIIFYLADETSISKLKKNHNLNYYDLNNNYLKDTNEIDFKVLKYQLKNTLVEVNLVYFDSLFTLNGKEFTFPKYEAILQKANFGKRTPLDFELIYSSGNYNKNIYEVGILVWKELSAYQKVRLDRSSKIIETKIALRKQRFDNQMRNPSKLRKFLFKKRYRPQPQSVNESAYKRPPTKKEIRKRNRMYAPPFMHYFFRPYLNVSRFQKYKVFDINLNLIKKGRK